MAPWPGQSNQLKENEKSSKSFETTQNNIETANPSDSSSMISTEQKSQTEPVPSKEMAETSFIQKQDIVSTPIASAASSEVSGLNDLQLKALLEEAITYKRPKDREGKSDLFKELLQEAEAETETNKEIRSSTATSAARPIPRRRLSRRGPSGDSGGTSAPGPVLWDGYNSGSNSSVAERQTRGGSLQNIVHACSSEIFSFKPTPTTSIKNNSMTSEQQPSPSTHQNSTSNKCDIQNGVEMLLLAPMNNNISSSNNNNNNGSINKHRTTSNSTTTNITESSKPITVTTLSSTKMPYSSNSVSEDFQKSETNKSNTNQNASRRHENITAVVNGLDNVPFQLNSSYNCVRSLGVSSSVGHTSTHTAALSALTEKLSPSKCSSVFDQMTAISHPKESASTLVTASLATPVTSSAAAVASLSEAISHQPQPSPNSVTSSKTGSSSFSILSSNNWLSDPQRFQPMSNSLDSKNKVDENFNTNTRNFDLSSSSGTKYKFRRNKTNNPPNVIMSQNIAGYRGDTEDLEDLLQYIESSSTTNVTATSGNNINSNQTSTSVNTSITHSSNDGHKVLSNNHSSKRETKHQNKTNNHTSTSSSRRQSESNLKKSTSMEEIRSKTKFEDLTNQSTITTPPQNSNSNNEKTSNNNGQVSRRKKDNSRIDRRSWGNEETNTNQEGGFVMNRNNSNTSKSSNVTPGSNLNDSHLDSSPSWADMDILVSGEPSSPLLLSPHNQTTGSCSSGSCGGQPSPDFHLVKKKNRKSKAASISSNSNNSNTNSYSQQNIHFSSGSRRSRSGENRNQSTNNNYHYQTGQNASNNHHNKENNTCRGKSLTGIPQEDTNNSNNSHNSQYRNNSRGFYTKYQIPYPSYSQSYTRWFYPRRNFDNSYKENKKINLLNIPSQSIQVTVADCRNKTYSVPPSDKSDSSDVDSVHSLPVSSTTVRPTIEKTSTSSGSTPQASYADIARTTSQMPTSTCQQTTPPLTPNNNTNQDSFTGSCTSQTTSSSSPTTTNDSSFNLATAGQWPCICITSTTRQVPLTNTITNSNEQPLPTKLSPQVQQTKKDAGTNTNTDEITYTNIEQTQHLTQILQINQGPKHSSKTIETYGSYPLPTRHKNNHSFSDIARPPVIILNHSDSISNDNLDQFSFGFEINEALLNEDNNLGEDSEQIQETHTQTIRNPPATPRLEIILPAIPQHKDLINYINNSWNEILRGVDNKNSIYYSSEL